MTTDPETTWLAELLEALERHTMAVQTNTAAVNTLLAAMSEAGFWQEVAGGGRANAETVARVKASAIADLRRNLEEGRRLLEQLEGLRQAVAPVDTSAPPAQTGE